jgi:transcriptional regulator with XRE-family HTH domain
VTDSERRGLAPLTAYIRSVMDERGLTLETVARRAGMPLSTVGDYSSGVVTGAKPRRRTLEKLASGLGVPLDDLLAVAGLYDSADEQALIRLFRQLPSLVDRRQAVAVLRAHVKASRER